MEPTEAIVKNTEWFLEVFSQYNIKATFFVLGEVAKKFPFLIRTIADNDHEIGVHGFYHRQIYKLTEQEFSREVGDAKKLLEDIASVHILGHRAPVFSLNSTTQWAFDVLAQWDFEYDSSVSPRAGKRYGWPGFSKDICKIDLPSGQSIIEVPMSTVTVLGKTLPAAGGGYIRHFPYAVTKWAMKQVQKERPVIAYLHPYEIDTKVWPYTTKHLRLKDRYDTYKYHKLQMRNRKQMKAKLRRLFIVKFFDVFE